MRRAHVLVAVILVQACAVGNSRRVGNGDGGTDGSVTEAVCGNSIVEPGEECDDGNTINGDGCSATCMLEHCSSESCWWGCCDRLGQCVAGTEDPACGAGGVPCASCTATGEHCEEQACEPLPSCEPGDTVPCGSCGTRFCLPGGTWGDCTNEGECTAGAQEQGGACGNCGILERQCDSACAWGAWTCTGEGSCSPGAMDTGGSCGVGGYEQRICTSSCTWGQWTCEGEGECVPGTVETGASCGNCGTQKRTCLSTGIWSTWTCDGEGVCSSGTSQTGSSCGNCGTQQRTCTSSCTWTSWTCAGEGVCSPGGKETGTSCCGIDANNVRTCTSSCSWSAWVCTGNTTCSVPGHLTCSNNNDPCTGVTPESWRCVHSPYWNLPVSQYCRDGLWKIYNLSPRDCRNCCGGYTIACAQ